ncbi:unnamed protein product, partial [marine sediment metagenome]
IVTITPADILQALNRGQKFATDLLSRHYPDPLLVKDDSALTTISGQQSYALPENIFEDKLQKVEILESGIAWEVKRINYREVSYYETNSQVSRPFYYYIMEKQFYLVPTPSGGKTIRYWYLREPETLIEPQGRVTTVDVANNYVTVDDIGSDLTTDSDELKNYINIVDAQSGKIKVSLQIQALDTSAETITIKTSPDRSTVWNRTIASAITTDVEVDDYVCLSRGNCIPYLKDPISNYIIQYAVLELKRKLGEPIESE